MERHAPEIVETVQTIQKHLGAAKATIALKRHYHEAAKAISDAAAGTGVEVYLSELFYPAGDEQNLVYCIRARRSPPAASRWMWAVWSAMSAPSSISITPCRASR